MTPTDVIILAFPCELTFIRRRTLRKDLLAALRAGGSPLIFDLSNCRSLTYRDIDLLLECIARVAGRDTKLCLVAGSPANRVLLEVARIAAILPVYTSLTDALQSSATGHVQKSVSPISTFPGVPDEVHAC
jgi:anti-anti-sigma regulatory factor